jgi:hypothetical protein
VNEPAHWIVGDGEPEHAVEDQPPLRDRCCRGPAPQALRFSSERLAAGTASQWLRAAAAGPALHHHSPAGAQHLRLAAVPASMSPPRQPPHGAEPVSGLCAGTAICAERLRYLAPAFASRARFPAAATSASWQRTAHAAPPRI